MIDLELLTSSVRPLLYTSGIVSTGEISRYGNTESKNRIIECYPCFFLIIGNKKFLFSFLFLGYS